MTIAPALFWPKPLVKQPLSQPWILFALLTALHVMVLLLMSGKVPLKPAGKATQPTVSVDGIGPPLVSLRSRAT